MPTRVCMVIPTLVKGGAEKQLSLLAAGLDSNLFDVHVLVLTHSGPWEQWLRERGVKVTVIGKRFKADPTAYWRLSKTIREIAPDIVHTWLFAANCYGRYAAKRANVPVILAGERCVDPWKRWWHHTIDKSLVKNTQGIVTNTSAVVEFYRKFGMPTSQFHVIANAVPPTSVKSLSREQVFERLNLPPTKWLIGSVGRLWPQKGYDDLIWAAELLRGANPEISLVIVGDGPERERLQRLRDEYRAVGAVHFVGQRSDAAELMTGMDLLWNGSLYEGQSNTILEAMSLGLPVLASDIPGNRDLVLDQTTGILYPLGDVESLARATNVLLKNESQRTKIGQEAKRRIEQDFTVQRMVQAHADLYTKLLSEAVQ